MFENKTPTTIVTGFLGSGKTTIISHLIDYLQSNQQQVVYIKNEIGDTDIDTQIMQQKGIETEQLLNGCICCTLVGPFLNSIDELIEKFSPARIIIEASGAADPAALALMVGSHPRLIRDGVISVIDVVNFEGYEELTITAKEQTKFTDLLIFNKVELADLEQKQKVVGYVRELNSHSPIIEAPQGKIDPVVVFGISSAELDNLLHTHKPTDHHDHMYTDNFQTVTLTSEKVFKTNQLQESLAHLPKNVFRAKGIIQTVHGPQIFNTVAGRTTFEAVNDERTGRKQSIFVFIGVNIHHQKEDLIHILQNSTRS